MSPFEIDETLRAAFAHDQAGQRAQVEALCRQILAAFPNHDGALHLLGLTALKNNRLDVAIENLRRATEVNPTVSVYHINLGSALIGKDRLDEAIACYRRALELTPDFAEAHNNLGNVLNRHNKLDDAIACYRRALELKQGYFEAHNNLGAALRDQGKLDEAIACYNRALELRPDYVDALINLGHALKSQGRHDKADAYYRRALELMPNNADAHKNWSHLLLVQGDFDRGWPEYEWRWQCKTFTSPKRSFQQPQWKGGPLDGRTILLHAEQGLGDTLQFVRFAPLVAQAGGKVIVECQAPLKRFLQSSLPQISFIDQGKPLPPFDVHCPLLSLPLAFRTTLATIPREVPYLQADADRTAHWRNKFVTNANLLKVGLVWAGYKNHRDDRSRSLTLAALAPVGRAPGVRFYSLQKGEAAIQALQPPTGMPLVDWTNEIDDFASTAALIANLDLVISVDTAVAHLAGAMGKPVWTLLPFAPDWRWLLEREDSPWYPTMRLFRQSTVGDWLGVVERVANALGRYAAGKTSPGEVLPAGTAPAADLPSRSELTDVKSDVKSACLVENGPIRLKRGRHGPILYLVTDKYVGRSLDRYGEFSEGEADLFRQFVRPGWTVLEIGANMGAHTPSLARLAGPNGAVHAFEPQRVIFQILCANVALNAVSNVYTYHAAVGRETGTIAVPQPDYTATLNFGSLSLIGGLDGERVPLITVDSLNLTACHMMKVDVEGMEGDVIAGAEQTIRRFRPVLYVENDRENKSAELIRRILALNYRLYWHLPYLFNPNNFFGETDNVFGTTVSVNMLGLHGSVAQNIAGLREITDPRKAGLVNGDSLDSANFFRRLVLETQRCPIKQP